MITDYYSHFTGAKAKETGASKMLLFQKWTKPRCRCTLLVACARLQQLNKRIAL